MIQGKHERNVGPAIASRRDEGTQKVASVQSKLKELATHPQSSELGISVQSVARCAGVSRAFIYNHPELYKQIVEASKGVVSSALMDDNSASVLIKALRKKVTSLEANIRKLERERAKLQQENVAWKSEREALWGRIAKLTGDM